MAHKRKKRRTQTLGQADGARANGVSKTNPAERTPKSMVIRMGASNVGPSVTQLVKDMRTVMEPHTAARLKERRSNRLRDYTSMAGPLGVTHFLLFSRSDSGNTNLRLAITPRGPTLNFRVEMYSLCRDIVKAQRRPKAGGGGIEHMTPPLLVMNNFTTPTSTATSSIPKHLENLTTTVFQSLFPAISPQRTPLSSIRRVLLLNRDPPKQNPNKAKQTEASTEEEEGTYTLSLRHYAITTRPLVPLSRGLKRLRAATQHAKSHAAQKPQPSRSAASPSPSTASTTTATVQKPKSKSRSSLPNLSRLDDVADYLLDPAAAGGYTSASDTEADMTDAEVEVLESRARRVPDRHERAKMQAARLEKQEAAAQGEGEGEEDADTQRRRRGAQQPAPVQKRAIRLTELGPRMKLRLVKVEEGLCDGKVLWHEFVTKTSEEEKVLDEVWEGRRKEREERRRVQRENVERKRREAGKGKGEGEGGSGAGDGAGDVVDEYEDEWDDDFDDDEMVEPDEEEEDGAGEYGDGDEDGDARELED